MIKQDLLKLEAEGNPIRIGVSGAGWIGSGFTRAVSHFSGMRVDVVADPDVNLARQSLLDCRIPADQIIEADQPGKAMDALRAGKRVVTPLYGLAAQLEAIDIVADVTPYPASGAETAYSCIQYHKDIVMVNIEADVTVGRILKKLAKEAGVLYTVSSGDEPGCLMELWDFVTCMGYTPVVIGKGKNNPLNPQATPDTVAESARKANKDVFQVASYVDGTKTMFEMACAANATGCRPQQRSMIGPQADLSTVSQIFALKEDGGIIERAHTVDFVQGDAMSGGVFIVVRVDDERICDDLRYLKVGKGKYFTFFRPYHLWFLEAPISLARAYLYRQTTLVALDEPVAESMATAKRDLKPGDRLDTFGGYTFYGQIECADIARDLRALPVGLAPGAEMVKAVQAGGIITWDDVRLDEDSLVVRLRRQQDAMV
ncbi:MAG: NAD(P)-dependent oxidoreductase [Anaerolineae bacterium]|nr:NAD(P)-dependent oxidoreductase [Anaerolineae bacterium]